MPGPRSPREMMEAVARNLPQNTGRSLDEWVALVRADGPAGVRERRAWLKERYGFGNTTTLVIADAAQEEKAPEPTDAERLDGQYAGPKSGLRPIFDRLAAVAQALGPDVTLGFRKTYVTVVRRSKFAEIKPTANGRIDLGLALDDAPESARLRTMPGSDDRMNRTVALTRPEDVDGEVRAWLRRAYEINGRPSP